MEYRKSRQRDKILHILRESSAHPTAESIYATLKKDIPGLSLGTVYRNLKILMEQGHIQKIPFGSGHDRFEAKIDPHYHLICEKCGSVADFTMDNYAKINTEAEARSSFKITRHRIDFFGICNQCQKQLTIAKQKGDS